MTDREAGKQYLQHFQLERIDRHAIIFCVTSLDDYKLERYLVVENWQVWGQYLLINGWHCSCYEFDETDWDARTYQRDELIKLAKSWLAKGTPLERQLASLIVGYFPKGADDDRS